MVQGRRTVGASASVAVWGLVVFSALSSGNRTWLYSLLLLPFTVALAAHARPLARWFVPCRTVAWVLLWSVPAGVIALKLAPDQPFLGTIAAWLLAAAVLGWRVAKGIQDTRMYGGRDPTASQRDPGGADRQPRNAAQGNHTAGHPGTGQPGPRPATPGHPATASGPRRRRCRTASTPAATRPARPGRGRRSRSRTRWPNSTR